MVSRPSHVGPNNVDLQSTRDSSVSATLGKDLLDLEICQDFSQSVDCCTSNTKLPVHIGTAVHERDSVVAQPLVHDTKARICQRGMHLKGQTE